MLPEVNEVDIYTANRHIEPIEPMYTAQEIAKLLKTTDSNVYILMQTGELSHIRFGRLVRVRQSDLKNFIRDHAV
jgi:excisionase family DNA binding protein